MNPSNWRWMPSCVALKSSVTWSSTSTCSGASPVPRQQYQRIRTSPGSGCEPVTGSGVATGSVDSAGPDAGADSPGATDAGGAADGATDAELGPQAPTSRASTDSRTAIRPIV